MPRPRIRRLRARRPGWRLLASLALLAVLPVACDDGGAGTDGLEATGVIVAVRGSITKTDEFDLLLPDGSRLTIVPDGSVLVSSGFSPSHLREHMTLAEQITVTYRDEGGQNVMTAVGDSGD